LFFLLLFIRHFLPYLPLFSVYGEIVTKTKGKSKDCDYDKRGQIKGVRTKLNFNMDEKNYP